MVILELSIRKLEMSEMNRNTHSLRETVPVPQKTLKNTGLDGN